ncbi:Transcriptional regulator [Tenacibaculum litopenaei]|uniref:helix-turn-helix domain-containing protein n=1 Tax=Tenacibaculum litopenaei TaxID=396016 RepID=UPI00389508F4
MPKIHFQHIEAMHEYYQLAAPEHPLFSIMHTVADSAETVNCDTHEYTEPIEMSCDFYAISLKRILSGELTYGRTKYDCTKGTLLFTAPNQVLTFREMVLSEESYHIAFHKDYIRNCAIYDKIRSCSFFDYHVNEALHLAPREEQIIKDIFKNMTLEYQNNQDEFSKEILLRQLETLLTYADRFYKRQFLNRTVVNKEVISRFREVLTAYFDRGLFAEEGIPSVEWMARELKLSHRYMSDTIKAETGKTAVDQINLFLVEEAKNLLLNPKLSIAETAYQLGFEYPQYFTRIFKKKVGVSPSQYIKTFREN